MNIVVDVYISEQIRFIGKRVGSGFFDSGVDFLFDFGVDLGDFFLGEESIIETDVFDLVDAVSFLAYLLDFLSGSVRNTRVRHRVAVISVSLHLNEKRSVFQRIVLGPLHSSFHCEIIISVNLNSGNCIASGEKFGVSSSSFDLSTHAVQVVLAHIKHGQLPQFCHISSLSKLALVSSTITIHSNSNIGFILVLESKGESSSKRKLSSDDSVSSEKVIFSSVKVHRSSFSASGSGFSAHHFGDDLVG